MGDEKYYLPTNRLTKSNQEMLVHLKKILAHFRQFDNLEICWMDHAIGALSSCEMIFDRNISRYFMTLIDQKTAGA